MADQVSAGDRELIEARLRGAASTAAERGVYELSGLLKDAADLLASQAAMPETIKGELLDSELNASDEPWPAIAMDAADAPVKEFEPYDAWLKRNLKPASQAARREKVEEEAERYVALPTVDQDSKRVIRSLLDARGDSFPTVGHGATLTAAQGEQCICAALRLANGEVWRGHRHDNCIQVAGKAGVSRDDIAEAEQGFITSRNRFVGREEGAQIQNRAGIVSAHTGQPIAEMLFSEDLYLRAWREAALTASPADTQE